MSLQEEENILEELASLPSFHHPTVSTDGSKVALYYDISGRNELHVIDVETGEIEQWSNGEVPRNARWWVAWAGDSERVFFHLDDAGNEQNDIHMINAEGAVESVVEVDAQAIIHDVSEDGETLLFGNNDDGQMNVYRHDMSTGDTSKLTEYDRAVWGSVISPDGSRFAYSTNETDDYDNRDVYIADIDGSNPRNLSIGEIGAESSPADWHPDGDRLLVSDNTEDLTRAGIYNLERDEVTWYGELEANELPVAFMPTGDRFLAIRTRNAAIMPVVYDIETGDSKELDIEEGVSSFGGIYSGAANAVIDDDRVLLVHTTPDRRPEILVYHLDTDEYEVLLEAEYGSLDPEIFVDTEYFRFKSHDGLDIGALLYDSGQRPSPLIVNPHGGPRAADFKSFNLYTQFLLTRGYSVLQVNYRGSMGRGREFVELLIDDWGGDEQADIAAGVEHVLDTYDWIDPDRVAVFGGSYGGYSAFMQLLQYPELYDAGVAWIGVTDLVDMYENTMPHFRTELMEKYLGSPSDNPELYEERSPTSLVDNLAAPLLIVHGINDRRVPISQARIFKGRLDEAGYVEGEDGDYEYVELGEEGHASTDIDQKIRMFQTLDDFLDRRFA